MNPAENTLAAWVHFSLIEGIGPITAQALLERFETVQPILEWPIAALQDHWAQAAEKMAHSRFRGLAFPGGLTDQGRHHNMLGPIAPQVEAALRWAQAPGHHLITAHDARVPALLRETGDAPLLLYAVGDCALLRAPAIAIVGSRHATVSGTRAAIEFAAGLSALGLCVISGMAYGIDAAAHHGALQSQGKTIGVLGTGIDQRYPFSHGRQFPRLFEAMEERGLLLSEWPLGMPPLPPNFPRRNRTIAGLSLGTLVIEAALKSGSLITARQALEYNREVFALPGSIHSPQARGCNRLIRDGACLVENIGDLVQALGDKGLQLMARAAPALSAQPASPDAPFADWIRAFGHDPFSAEDLCLHADIGPERAMSALVELTMAGVLNALEDGRYQRQM